MKQKNPKWIVYFILFALLGAVVYLSVHDITPISKHIEKDISVNMR